MSPGRPTHWDGSAIQLIAAKRLSREPGEPAIIPKRSVPSAPLSPNTTKIVFSYSPIFFRCSMSRPMWWSMFSTMPA